MDFFATQMLPYTIAIMIFAIFAFLEFASMLFGWGIFSFLDSIFDIDLDADLEAQGALSNFFGFVNPQNVPFSMVLISFFFLFGFLGTLLQNIFGLMPLWMSLPIVLIVTIVLLRNLTNLLAKIMPKEVSEVVSTDSFIGKKATILDPKATSTLPARAKVKDIYNQEHYIRVKPLDGSKTLYENDIVLIVRKDGDIFLVEESL